MSQPDLESAPTSAPRPARRGRRFVLLVLVFVVALTAALFAVEWTMQTFDLFGVNDGARQLRYRAEALEPTWTKPDGENDLDGTLFVMRPGLDLALDPFHVRTNRLGFRGPEIEVPKPAGTHRTLVLGDSVAFGWGVDDEVTFLRRAEARLNQRDDDVTHEIVNTGILLYDSVQQRAMLERRGLGTDPDLVVLVYVVNDIEPTRDLIEALLGLRPVPVPAGGVTAPTTLQRLATFVQPALPSIAQLMNVYGAPAHDWSEILAQHDGVFVPELIGEGPRGWQRSQEALLRMRDLCQARGIPFVVLDHSLPAVRALPDFCREHEIPLAPFRFDEAELGRPIFNSMLDPHANALGHELLLQKWEQAMRDLGLMQ